MEEEESNHDEERLVQRRSEELAPNIEERNFVLVRQILDFFEFFDLSAYFRVVLVYKKGFSFFIQKIAFHKFSLFSELTKVPEQRQSFPRIVDFVLRNEEDWRFGDEEQDQDRAESEASGD